MENTLLIAQITLGIIITVVILLQAQGTGLGSSFGGSESYHTKRGVEKAMYYATMICIALFVVVSVLVLL